MFFQMWFKNCPLEISDSPYQGRADTLMILVQLSQVLQQSVFPSLWYSGWLAYCYWRSIFPSPICGVCGSSECLSLTIRRISESGWTHTRLSAPLRCEALIWFLLRWPMASCIRWSSCPKNLIGMTRLHWSMCWPMNMSTFGALTQSQKFSLLLCSASIGLIRLFGSCMFSPTGIWSCRVMPGLSVWWAQKIAPLMRWC